MLIVFTLEIYLQQNTTKIVNMNKKSIIYNLKRKTYFFVNFSIYKKLKRKAYKYAF